MDGKSREVPVWTLATEDVKLPALVGDVAGAITPQRMEALRTALASLAESAIATLEVHPVEEKRERSAGIVLGNTSPLAKELTGLIDRTPAGRMPGGEALYRMIIPARVASHVGGGLVTPMMSKSVPNGIHSALMGSSGIAAQASFVPVVGTGTAVVAGASAITVAAPLIMMALATGLSMRSELLRQQELSEIKGLLEKLHEDRLDGERNELDSCIKPIEKATAIVLDEGVVGKAIGLDTTVGKIETAIAAAHRRLARWQKSLDGLPDGPVELPAVKKAFPGIGDPAGEFRAHVDLAKLAITLKRRVILLQAVEQAQLNPGNPFERFVRALAADGKDIDELEQGIAELLRRLSDLHLDRSHGMRDFVFSAGEVDELLKLSRDLRQLGDLLDTSRHPNDVVIDIARDVDGSLVVYPALTLAS